MSNEPIVAIFNKCSVRPADGKEAVPCYTIERIGPGVFSAKRTSWWNDRDGVEVIAILPKDSLVVIKKSKNQQTGSWSKEQFAEIQAEKLDGSGFVEGWIKAKHLHKMRDV